MGAVTGVKVRVRWAAPKFFKFPQGIMFFGIFDMMDFSSSGEGLGYRVVFSEVQAHLADARNVLSRRKSEPSCRCQITSAFDKLSPGPNPRGWTGPWIRCRRGRPL